MSLTILDAEGRSTVHENDEITTDPVTGEIRPHPSSYCSSVEERNALSAVISALNDYFSEGSSATQADLEEKLEPQLKVLGLPTPTPFEPIPYDSASLQDSNGNLNYSQVGSLDPTGCGGQRMPALTLDQLMTNQSYVCKGSEWILIVRPPPQAQGPNPYKTRAQQQQAQEDFWSAQQKAFDDAAAERARLGIIDEGD